jgi:bifunctional ADP-heptose synthase (sugar kinase/adenylyltransferase)
MVSLGCNMSANAAPQNDPNTTDTQEIARPPATELPTFVVIPSETPTPIQCHPPKIITQSSGYITRITLAEDSQKNSKEPIKPTDVFGINDTVHAVAAVKNAPSHTDFKAVWYANDTQGALACNMRLDEYQVSTNGTRNLDFMLKPTSPFPVGTYRAEIYVNGTLDSVVNFSVK